MENYSFVDILVNKFCSFERGQIVKNNSERWKKRFDSSVKQFSDVSYVKKKIEYSRNKCLYNIENQIFNFEKKFIDNTNRKMFFAQTDKDVYDIISRIIKEENISNVVFSKSNLLDEISLNSYLKKKQLNVTKTNIGDFILELEHGKPSHIVTSTYHKNLEEISSLYNKEFGTDENITAQDVIDIASKKIKENIKGADALVSGANFLVSETGSIVFIEDEGDINRAMSMVKTHIIIAGMEKIISNLKELNYLLPVVSTFATGQNLASYITIITKNPKRIIGENQKIFLILVNKGRTDLLQSAVSRNILKCIRCGACANVCPIYKNLGGNVYNCVYPGPLGLILATNIESSKEYKDLPYACTLCGKCKDICPAGIDLTTLIIQARKDVIEKDIHSLNDQELIMLLYKKTLKRKRMNGFHYGFKQWRFEKVISKQWGNKRVVPKFSRKTFSEKYIDLHKGEENLI